MPIQLLGVYAASTRACHKTNNESYFCFLPFFFKKKSENPLLDVFVTGKQALT